MRTRIRAGLRSNLLLALLVARITFGKSSLIANEPTEFSCLWEWSRAPGSEPVGGIDAPVDGNGIGYVSAVVCFGDAVVIALSELDDSAIRRRRR